MKNEHLFELLEVFIKFSKYDIRQQQILFVFPLIIMFYFNSPNFTAFWF
jgi:hypothetical protein